MYWGNPNLHYVKLNPDMISYSGAVMKDSSMAKVKGQPDPSTTRKAPGHSNVTVSTTWPMLLPAARKALVMP